MRGFFAIGIDGVSKAGNMGNLIRTAHGFGASFVFTIASKINGKGRSLAKAKTDTSGTAHHVPFFEYETIDDLVLPRGCRLVGIELFKDAIELPSFRHPPQAAYILGSERFSLSEEVRARCDQFIQIPTKFSLNVATAGAIVMYDRLTTYGSFPERPVYSADRPLPKQEHVHGLPKTREERQARKARLRGEQTP